MAAISIDDFPRKRKEALERGVKRYFTGEPCPNGHLAPRAVASRACTSCVKESLKVWRKENASREREKRLVRYAANADLLKEKARLRARGYWDADREKILDRNKTWRDCNREKWLAGKRAYAAANREREMERLAAWAAANPEKIRAIKRAWIKANPEKVLIGARNRRARKLAADGSHTAADIARIRKAQKDRCGYCRKKLNGGGHVDHIIALSRGGSNWPSNLQILCEPCNLSKNASDPVDFAQSLGMLI